MEALYIGIRVQNPSTLMEGIAYAFIEFCHGAFTSPADSLVSLASAMMAEEAPPIQLTQKSFHSLFVAAEGEGLQCSIGLRIFGK